MRNLSPVLLIGASLLALSPASARPDDEDGARPTTSRRESGSMHSQDEGRQAYGRPDSGASRENRDSGPRFSRPDRSSMPSMTQPSTPAPSPSIAAQGDGNVQGRGGDHRWGDRRVDGQGGDHRSRDGRDGSSWQRDGRSGGEWRRDERTTSNSLPPTGDVHRDRLPNDQRWNEHRGDRWRYDPTMDRSRQAWSRDWRDDHHFDWRGYRDHNRSIFRIGRYYDPFGRGYNRWSIESLLFPQYYGSNFWLDDPWMYRLPPAYGPYRWVRYWDDALLVDLRTGRVVDVVYNIFW